MKTKDELTPVEVFSGTPWETAMVKSMLESEGIEAFLRNEIMGSLNPWHSSPGGVNPVKVFVAQKDLEESVKIVREYQTNAKK